MAQHLPKSELTRAAWRRQAAASGRRARSREAARVVVACSSPSDAEAELGPFNLELEGSSSGNAGRAWRCRELPGASWEEAISAAGCTEVVLTAHLGGDGRARHLVLALAEFLTQKLFATKPYIRVRFHSPSSPQASSCISDSSEA